MRTFEEDLADEIFTALYRTGRLSDAEWAELAHPRLLAHWAGVQSGGFRGETSAGDRGGRSPEEIVFSRFTRAWRVGEGRGLGPGELGQLHLEEVDHPDADPPHPLNNTCLHEVIERYPLRG